MKAFYYNAETDEEVENPIELASFEAIIEKFKTITACDGSFFGVIDDKDNTLQFAWEDDDDFSDEWLVDIPAMAKNGSYQTHASFDKCITYISNFYNNGELPINDCVFESFE